MDLDSLITVAALFITIYATISGVRRLEIPLGLGKTAWVILCAALVSILYLQFYSDILLAWNYTRA